MAKKKIKFKKRLHNMWTWVKNPGFLFCLMLAITIVTALCFLADPCGRYSHAEQGICSNGQPFQNPVVVSLVITLILLPIVLLSLSGSENTPWGFKLKGTVTGIKKYIQKWPKWRKKWYPVSYACFYLLLAGIAYCLNQDSGLKWYHYAVQFGIIIPFLVSYPAYIAVNKARKKFKIK